MDLLKGEHTSKKVSEEDGTPLDLPGAALGLTRCATITNVNFTAKLADGGSLHPLFLLRMLHPFN